MTTYAFPATQGPTETEWTYVANDDVFQSRGGSIQSAARGPDMWRLRVRCATRTLVERAALQAWALKLGGRANNFSIKDHSYSRRGSGAGTPLINGANQTGASIVTDGWTASATGVLLAGDMIQIRNQIVMVTADVNADGGGNATLNVRPKIRIAPADNSPVVTATPVGIFKLIDPDFAWTNNPGTVTSDFEFRAIEDVLA